jgi:hypothetical protein
VSSQRPEDFSPGCPRCGAPFDQYQEYCLECGARLPGSYAFGREIPGGGQNPNWLWAALVSLLLVALVAGAIVAIAATSGDEEGRPGVSGTVGTATEGFPAGTGEVVEVPGGTGAAEPPPSPAEEPQPTPPAQVAPIDWPAGTNGYTVVLASVDASAGRSGATPIARKAIDAGLPDVGVLDSSGYASLKPGYYVVFSGVYTTRKEAEASLGTARSAGFPLAYPREISN